MTEFKSTEQQLKRSTNMNTCTNCGEEGETHPAQHSGWWDWQTILNQWGRSVRSATVKYLTMPTENQNTLSDMLKSGSSRTEIRYDRITYSFDLLYDIKTQEDLQHEIDYLGNID